MKTRFQLNRKYQLLIFIILLIYKAKIINAEALLVTSRALVWEKQQRK